MKTEKVKKYSIADAFSGTIALPMTSDVEHYFIDGAVANPQLAGDLTINVGAGTPKKGQTFYILYTCNLDTNGHQFFLFNQLLKAPQATEYWFAIVSYDGSAWRVNIMPNFGTRVVAGGNLATDIVDGTTIELAADVLGVKDGGIGLPQLLDMTATYILIGDSLGKPSLVQVTGDMAISDTGVVTFAADSVDTAEIVDDAITLGKLQGITRGNLIIGDAAGDPVLLDASASGLMLIGDGNDLTVVAISGDITISAGGVVSIGANKILTSMILDKNVTLGKIEDLASGQILAGSAGNRPVAVTPSGDITMDPVGAFTLAAGAVDGTKVDDASITPVKITQFTEGNVDTAIIGSKILDGATLKALLDGTINDLFTIKANERALYIIFFTQTPAGMVGTVDCGPNGIARTAGADPNGILKVADGNAAGSYPSYQATYMGDLQAFGYFRADATGKITIESSANLSASAFVGSVIMYHTIVN